MGEAKKLGIISLIMIGSAFLLLGYTALPAPATSPTGSGGAQEVRPQVCDIVMNFAGTWHENFLNKNTIRDFIAVPTVSNCRDARNFEIWGLFNIPFQTSIFPANFAPIDITVRVELADQNGVVRYGSDEAKLEVPPLRLTHSFSGSVSINGVLEESYTTRTFSNIGFDDASPVIPKLGSVKVPF